MEFIVKSRCNRSFSKVAARKSEKSNILVAPEFAVELKAGIADSDVEFLEKPVQVHVNGVRRNLESFGNLRLVMIVENALDNLQLALCDTQGAPNLKPSMIGKQ